MSKELRPQPTPSNELHSLTAILTDGSKWSSRFKTL